MKVVAHVGPEPQTFTIECGDGTQTFRWLALAAAQRYRRAAEKHGKFRHREGQYRRQGSFVPTNVAKKGQDFLFPNARLKSSLRDGGEVWVELGLEHEGSAGEPPDVTVWSALAFSHSEALAEKREAARSELQRKLEEVKGLMKEQMERREQRLREHEVLMREINLGELARPAMQEAAVDYDIRRMKAFTLNMAPSEYKGAREVLLEHFGFIHRAHRLYSSYGQEGYYTDMTFQAFATFCHDCGLLSANDSIDKVADVFLCVVDSMSAEEEDFPNGDLLEAASRGDESVDLSALQIFDERAPLYSFTQEEAEEVLRTFLLSRALFVKALFHLAAATEGTGMHPDGEGSAAGGSRAHDSRHALRHVNAPITTAALRQLLADRLRARMKRLAATPLRKQVYQKDVQSVLATSVVTLHGVFTHFSAAASDQEDVMCAGTLSAVELSMLLRDGGVIGGGDKGAEQKEEKEDEEVLKEGRKYFTNSQADSPFGTKDFLIFAEFLEALARAAYDHCAGASLKEKVSTAIGQVARLYKPRMSQVPPRAGGEWEELPDDEEAEVLPSMEELDEVAQASASGAGTGK